MFSSTNLYFLNEHHLQHHFGDHQRAYQVNYTMHQDLERPLSSSVHATEMDLLPLIAAAS